MPTGSPSSCQQPGRLAGTPLQHPQTQLLLALPMHQSMTITVLHIPLNAMVVQLEAGWLFALKPCITHRYLTCACGHTQSQFCHFSTLLCEKGAFALLAMASEPQSTAAGSIDVAPGIRNLACLHGVLPSIKGPFSRQCF